MSRLNRYVMLGVVGGMLLAVTHEAAAGWGHHHAHYYGAPAYYAPAPMMVAPSAFVAPSTAFVAPSSAFVTPSVVTPSAFSFQVVPATTSNASSQADIGNFLDTFQRFKQILDNNRSNCNNNSDATGDSARLKRMEDKLDEIQKALKIKSSTKGDNTFDGAEDTDLGLPSNASANSAPRPRTAKAATAESESADLARMTPMERLQMLQYQMDRLDTVQRELVRTYDAVTEDAAAGTAQMTNYANRLQALKAQIDAMRKK